MSPFSVLFVVVLGTALGWKAYQLYRAPQDRPLLAVTLCLACAAAAFPLGLPAGARLVDSIFEFGVSELGQNVLLLATVYWLMCFYLFSATDLEQGRRRAKWEAVPLAAVVVAITVATFATPVELRWSSFGEADMQVTGAATFYLLAGLYLVYAIATALHWTWRHARATRPPLSVGLRLAGAGMAGMVLAGSVRAGFVVIRWSGGSIPSWLNATASLLLSLAIPLFVIGISYPSVATRIAALRVWRQHRTRYRQLHPLWMELHQVYPEHLLGRVPGSAWRDALRLRGVHRRYYRRVIECRDGLVRISPYLAHARETANNGTSLAELLRAALRAHAEGEPVSTKASAVAVPLADDLDADVYELVELSNALRARAG
ncbi:MAB_1171c family putative transporter [Amycolatopsis cihanbeyliensis]|uniref:MAB_1171c family putative transporter n=1 Tax=Amycolatopsis cihanbeyliensis TaxID=1128664 RepID=UPI001FE663DD|nr:MAB_1171c family putative transporter [Amycolatopsis cihanbeyliensis]